MRHSLQATGRRTSTIGMARCAGGRDGRGMVGGGGCGRPVGTTAVGWPTAGSCTTGSSKYFTLRLATKHASKNARYVQSYWKCLRVHECLCSCSHRPKLGVCNTDTLAHQHRVGKYLTGLMALWGVVACSAARPKSGPGRRRALLGGWCRRPDRACPHQSIVLHTRLFWVIRTGTQRLLYSQTCPITPNFSCMYPGMLRGMSVIKLN